MYDVLCKMVLIALIFGGTDLPLLFKLNRIWSVNSHENH